MQFLQLLQLREAGIPIPSDVLLNASTMQNKKDLVEAIQKQEQIQMQAQQMQMNPLYKNSKRVLSWHKPALPLIAVLAWNVQVVLKRTEPLQWNVELPR